MSQPSTAARSPHRRAAALAASVGIAALLLAGCSAGSSTDSAGAASVAIDAPAPQDANGKGYGTASREASSGAVDANGTPLAVSAERSVIVRADMTVQVDDLRAAADGLAAAASRHDATIASQTTSSGDGYLDPMPLDEKSGVVCPSTGCPTAYASSVTTLRVDNSEVDALIRDLAALGTVASSYRTTDDVTAQVADVGARLATAEASLRRVRLLMDKAVTIADVVTLEAELSRRQADLESLQAQQRALADQTAQATVTVRLVDQEAPVVTEADTGFLAGLRAGWDAFTTAAVAGLTVLGAMVPFLLLLVPLGLLVWWLVRRSRHQAADPAPAAADPTA